MSLDSRTWKVLCAVLLVGLAAALVRVAWVGDDAYITLRTVENFIHGHGLVWNLGERVQVYTHPLWLFLLTGVRLLTGESYFGTIALSWGLTLASAALLVRLAGHGAAAAAVAALLLGSRSFLDYGVCGLENPLSFVLLAALAGVATSNAEPRLRWRWTVLLAALAATNRLDLGLLCTPLLLANWRGRTFGDWLLQTALGMTPLLAWLLFATVYYGSPFPITALAKATNLGVPAFDLWRQGLYFFEFTWTHDPLTLLTIGAGTCLGLVCGPAGSRPLALGMVLYCAYIVAVGGDFMGGRFFTPPFVVAVAILARILGQGRAWPAVATLATATVATLLPGLPDWTHRPASDAAPEPDYHGIADERRVYYAQQGLLSPQRSVPEPGVLTRNLRAVGRERPLVMIYGVAGRYPFEAGELLHVVDHCLLDPLLMRLPVPNPQSWRIGHFVRAMPEGYLESLAQDRPLVHHAGLARYHAALKPVIDVRVPLFAPERLQALWDLWTGKHAAGLAAYVAEDYYHPPAVEVDGAALAQLLPNGLFGGGPQWFDEPQCRLVQRGGLRIRYPAAAQARRLELQLLGGRSVVYRLRLHRAGNLVGEHRLDAGALQPAAGMQPFACDLPAEQQEFDLIVVDCLGCPAEILAGVGSLRLVR